MTRPLDAALWVLKQENGYRQEPLKFKQEYSLNCIVIVEVGWFITF